jgi:hypothetical protein
LLAHPRQQCLDPNLTLTPAPNPLPNLNLHPNLSFLNPPLTPPLAIIYSGEVSAEKWGRS